MNKINNLNKIIMFACVLITLIITPWMNVDSMIIPKMVFLVLTASFLTPSLFLIIKNNFQIMSMLLKTVLIIVLFIVIQMVMVMIFTDSPLEQQFFGKTGRGLGFLTYLSLLIIFSTSIFVFQRQTIAKLCYALFYSSFLTSVYSIIQFYGFDIFNWTTRTNGIIGTIGNPNFQSSFSAIALITCFYYYHENSRKLKIFAIGNAIVSLYAIYLCQSWQGYALVIIGLILLLLQYFWYWSKALFKVSSLIVFLTSITVFFGIIKIGPLSDLLYKYSVKSRGEMWRSSFNASKDNPIFGIGIDSFGDYSLRYRNPVDVGGVNEFTDNSHNYYLEFSTTGGFPLLILNLILIVMVFYSLIKLIRRTSSFDPLISTIFCVWACHIAQSVISPASIPLLIWNYVMSGAIIGLASGINFEYLSKISKVKNSGSNFVRSRWLLVAFSIFLLYPYYEVDRLYLATSRSGDGLMAVRVAQMYPESVLRYQRIGRELLDSKLYDQALEVSRAAARFNPDSFSAWALILSNPKALDSERKKALQELKRIDPLNPEIKALRL